MRFRKDGIDSIARAKAVRDIMAALPGICTKSLTEDVLAPKKACIPVQPSRPIVAISMTLPVRINRDHRDDTAIGEEDMVERTISVHENLRALAANVLELRHESLEISRWQG